MYLYLNQSVLVRCNVTFYLNFPRHTFNKVLTFSYYKIIPSLLHFGFSSVTLLKIKFFILWYSVSVLFKFRLFYGQSRTVTFWLSIHTLVNFAVWQEVSSCWKIKFQLGHSLSMLDISSSDNIGRYVSLFTFSSINRRLLIRWTTYSPIPWLWIQ